MLHCQWPLSVWEASLLAQISFETSEEHDKLNCICIICFCMSDTELIVYSFRCVRFMCPSQHSLRQGHSSFVVRCVLRIANCANFDFGSPGGSMTVPAGFPHIDVPFSTAKDFLKFELHLSFVFCSYFLADPGDGYIPRRRALDAEHCKYHENSLCAHLNGMYPYQGFMCFFLIFFQKKNG